MILKLQTDSTGRSVLLYNEDRSVFYQCTPEESKRVYLRYSLGPLEKIYIEATLVSDGEGANRLELGDTVEQTYDF